MGKISVSDLSIGDWVQARMVKWDYEDLDITPPMRVAEISSDEVMLQLGSVKHYAFVDDLKPIHITAEVLEKNGETSKDYLAWLIAGRAVVEKESTGVYSVHIYDAAIDKVLVTACAQHVHQLQHALRLAGVEKEIVL